MSRCPIQLLQGSDIDAVAQVFRGKGVPELMQEEIMATWALGTFIAVLGHSLAVVHAGAMSQTLDDHVHGIVWMATTILRGLLAFKARDWLAKAFGCPP